MQADTLPERIDLNALGQGIREWHGSLSAEALTRLTAVSLGARDTAVDVQVDTTAEQPLITGTARCTVDVRCERCLEGMPWPVEVDFEVVAVDRLSLLDDATETAAEVEAPRGRLDLWRVVEDELILGLPPVPKHQDVHCDGGQRHFGPEGEPLPSQRSPFEALEALKGGRGDKDH